MHALATTVVLVVAALVGNALACNAMQAAGRFG